jgi:two-component system, chemotaxis family, protein-glutamate methylesterase/glutaminase
MDRPLRVLIVDDTVTYRKVASMARADLADVEVVGTAANGKIALQKIEQLAPDLLLLDVEMPEINGVELLRQLKTANRNLGVIMLSAVTVEGAAATVEALELGAFDFVSKPCEGSAEVNVSRLRKELHQKIQDYIRTRSIRQALQLPPNKTLAGGNGNAPLAAAGSRPARVSTVAERTVRPQVIALGISTGGPQALSRMMPALPKHLPVPLLVVQHMPPMFTRSLARDLDERCQLHVCEAADGQRILPGEAYIAPGGRQMKVQRENGDAVLRITDDPPENNCRPSVDYLFRSVAEVYGGNAVGVIMTGMGNDGTRGCRMLKSRGAAIVAQDEASCVVFGMPREPVEQGIADVVASLDAMAGELTQLAAGGRLHARSR